MRHSTSPPSPSLSLSLLHVSALPTAWHLPLRATVLTLQSSFVDWPAPLSVLLVLLSASITIPLSIRKWSNTLSLERTVKWMCACVYAYKHARMHTRFEFVNGQSVSVWMRLSFCRFYLFLFFLNFDCTFFFLLYASLCVVNSTRKEIWRHWRTTDLPNLEKFHRHGIHQNALKLLSTNLWV